MTLKLTIPQSLQPEIAAVAGGTLGWLLMHLLVTNWSSLKALFVLSRRPRKPT